MEDDCWFRNRPAIIWVNDDNSDSRNFGGADATSSSTSSSSSPNWDQDLLDQISSLSFSSSSLSCSSSLNIGNNNSNDNSDNDTNTTKTKTKTKAKSIITYETLLLITAHVVNSLQNILQDLLLVDDENNNEDNNNNNDDNNNGNNQVEIIGLPIGISITEGPLLPIAILAVHVLGIESFHLNLNSSNNKYYGILVPIEPNEGKHRLKHMIHDTKPILVLSSCVPSDNNNNGITEQQHRRIHESLKECCKTTNACGIITSHTTNREDSNTLRMHQQCLDSTSKTSTSPQIVDFYQLVYDAVQSCKRYQQQQNSEEHTAAMVSQLLQTSRYLDTTTDSTTATATTAQLVRKLCTCLSTTNTTNDRCVIDNDNDHQSNSNNNRNMISHIVYTSGTTGIPKGCISSMKSLQNYIHSKNKSHYIKENSIVLLASSLSFDPCLSDILATFYGKATLGIARRNALTTNLPNIINSLKATHVLCTPTLWNIGIIQSKGIKPSDLPSLQRVVLGGEPIPKRIVQTWATRRRKDREDCDDQFPSSSPEPHVRLFSTYGVTEACVYQTIGEVMIHDKRDDGQNVGRPLCGLGVGIINTHSASNTNDDGRRQDEQQEQKIAQQQRDYDSNNTRIVGEIVLFGKQIDEYSSYLNKNDLSNERFVNLERASLLSSTTTEDIDDEDSSSTTKDNLSRHYLHYCYKTGDKGYINQESGNLHVLGRIDGHDGMIKINGIRIELSEIESAVLNDEDICNNTDDPDTLLSKEERLLDDTYYQSSSPLVIIDCLATAVSTSTGSEEEDGTSKQIHAYVVLSTQCLKELNLLLWNKEHDNHHSDKNGCDEHHHKERGILCTGPLLQLLQARCRNRVRPGCLPSTFIIIRQIPLSPTGKSDRKKLPSLNKCLSLEEVIRVGLIGKLNKNKNKEDNYNNTGTINTLLWDYGKSGRFVANQIVDILNLQQCQKSLLTSQSNFAMVGGDSLNATLVVRALYAFHKGVSDSRFLGGNFGNELQEPFRPVNLIKGSLGDFVDSLDKCGVCCPIDDDITVNQNKDSSNIIPSIGEGSTDENGITADRISDSSSTKQQDEYYQDRVMYDALMEATVMGYTSIAMALLDVGVDPNFAYHGGRLSKVSDRRQRRKQFKGSPIHIACNRGDDRLVGKLLSKGSRFNSPDASGYFPIHLACSGRYSKVDNNNDTDNNNNINTNESSAKEEEDARRKHCVQLLFEAGVPLTMKDANKQTVLHCAARSNHCQVLLLLMNKWKEAADKKEIRDYGDNNTHKGGRFDWTDRWQRTPVHWAVLNGNVEALKVLIENGCSANPTKPKSNARTSLVLETPIEICRRLHGDLPPPGSKGEKIASILNNNDGF